MARKKKRKTQNQIDYEKQVRRIKQAVYRAKKKGYYFEDLSFIPQKPKRITRKAIERLSSITPSQVRASASFVDIDTGEIKKIEYPTLSVVKSVRERIKHIEPPQVYLRGHKGRIEFPVFNHVNYILEIFEDSLTYYGEASYSQYLSENMYEIMDTIAKIKYQDSDGDQISASFTRLAEILNGKELSISQSTQLSDYGDLYGYHYVD